MFQATSIKLWPRVSTLQSLQICSRQLGHMQKAASPQSYTSGGMGGMDRDTADQMTSMRRWRLKPRVSRRRESVVVIWRERDREISYKETEEGHEAGGGVWQARDRRRIMVAGGGNPWTAEPSSVKVRGRPRLWCIMIVSFQAALLCHVSRVFHDVIVSLLDSSKRSWFWCCYEEQRIYSNSCAWHLKAPDRYFTTAWIPRTPKHHCFYFGNISMISWICLFVIIFPSYCRLDMHYQPCLSSPIQIETFARLAYSQSSPAPERMV